MLFLSTFAVVLELYVSAPLPHTEKWHACRQALLVGKDCIKRLSSSSFSTPKPSGIPKPTMAKTVASKSGLLYRKGNDAIHQHAVFDRWLCRVARRCSCRACCAGGCLVCGGDNVETKMSTIWVRARARRGHWWKVVFGARARANPARMLLLYFGAIRMSAMRGGLISLLLYLLVLCVDQLTRLCC